MKLPISDIKPNPNNPRTITVDAFEKLKAKILRNPDGLSANKIVYKDGTIVAGNQRWRAIKELGLELQEDWFKDVSGWTDEQIKEYLVISNISDGEWDWDILSATYDLPQLEEWNLPLPKYMTEDLGEDFSLPEGDKSPFGQMTFMLADEQIRVINEALGVIKETGETFGNENGNGNKLYWIISQWLVLKK